MSVEETRHPRAPRTTLVWWVNTSVIWGLILAFTFFQYVDGYPSLHSIDALAMIAVALTLGSVLLRTIQPWAFLAVTAGLNFFYTLDTPAGFPGWGMVVALPFAVYAVASVVPMRVAIFPVISVELLLVLTALFARGVTLLNVYPISVTAFVVTSFAVGQVVYVRQKLIEATRRRAQEAEQTRDAVAASRVAQQRLETARDLHDLVGHQIVVINLQAEVARRAIPDAPDDAIEALDVIGNSAEKILTEIGQLLVELRSGPTEPLARLHGVGSLPELCRTLAAGGFPVSLRIDGSIPRLDPAVDEAAYRVLEEALVNAYKHGASGQPATAAVGWDDGDLVLVVSNAVDESKPIARSSGLGLRGIDERVSALGGKSKTFVDERLFQLIVRLPVSAP